MALRTFVKVGNITNLSDARYCAGMGVDLLGFQVVEGRPDYITPKQFQEIRGWVAGPRIIAQLYGISTAQELAAILENYRPDLLELGTKELAVLSGSLNLPYILSLKQNEHPGTPQHAPAYILATEDAANLEEISTLFPLLVEVQQPQHLQTLLDRLSPAGIALNGSAEIKPGLKNYEGLSEALEMLDADN